MNVRPAQARALRPAMLRSVLWPPALVAAFTAVALLAWRDELLDEPGPALAVVRVIAVLLALGAVFVLDDDAAGTVASSPTPLWWRRALRYVVAAALVLPSWVGVLVYAGARQPELPTARLSLELVALITVGFAVAAGVTRWRGVPDPGLAAALTIGGLALASIHLPSAAALFTAPGSPAWPPSTYRWAGLLMAALAVLVTATRDPARARGSRSVPAG